jgi:hypothetical protein
MNYTRIRIWAPYHLAGHVMAVYKIAIDIIIPFALLSAKSEPVARSDPFTLPPARLEVHRVDNAPQRDGSYYPPAYSVDTDRGIF